MRNFLKTTIAFLLFFVLIQNAFADKPAWPGIWTIWGKNDVSNFDKPWFKGTAGSITWKKIEPQKGKFDFKPIDDFVYKAVKNGLYFSFKVYSGYNVPDWIFENGVPKVLVDTVAYPYYLDEDYKMYFKNMIHKVAEHFKSYPENIRSKIAFIQCPAAVSGDPQPWYGKPNDPKYTIGYNSKEWEDYNAEIFSAYADAYKSINPPITLLTKPNENNFKKLLTYMSNLGVKTYTVAQGYQTNDDLKTEWMREAISKFTPDGRAIRARGEVDHIDWMEKNWYNEAPVWNMYSQCLWMLTYGLDALMVREKHVSGENAIKHSTAYQFFADYAGYKSAEDSHGAWCALRDGLDYSDKVRFPEDKFGPIVNGRNIDRYLKIANAFSERGAKMGETEYCWTDGVTWTKKAKAMNDVANNIWKDNYGMFMTQYKPNETSVGYWRVGSKEESYGRFARGFEHATGKNTLYFNIDDALFFNKPLAGAYPIEVKVIYFDSGKGKWELRYDATSGSKTAFTVKKTNSKTWKVKKIQLKDAYFGNRCPNATDLMLVNSDTEDDIFHMIEVTRKTGDRKGFWGIANH
jgi:hypothetical protein